MSASNSSKSLIEHTATFDICSRSANLGGQVGLLLPLQLAVFWWCQQSPPQGFPQGTHTCSPSVQARVDPADPGRAVLRI